MTLGQHVFTQGYEDVLHHCHNFVGMRQFFLLLFY